jgi:hypothetical protein
VIVGSRADPATTEHDVRPRKRARIEGNERLTIIARVMCPVEAEPPRLQQLDHFDQMLVRTFAGQDLVADDDEPEPKATHAPTTARLR